MQVLTTSLYFLGHSLSASFSFISPFSLPRIPQTDNCSTGRKTEPTPRTKQIPRPSPSSQHDPQEPLPSRGIHSPSDVIMTEHTRGLRVPSIKLILCPLGSLSSGCGNEGESWVPHGSWSHSFHGTVWQAINGIVHGQCLAQHLALGCPLVSPWNRTALLFKDFLVSNQRPHPT